MERLLFIHLVKVLHKVLYLRRTEMDSKKKKKDYDFSHKGVVVSRHSTARLINTAENSAIGHCSFIRADDSELPNAFTRRVVRLNCNISCLSFTGT